MRVIALPTSPRARAAAFAGVGVLLLAGAWWYGRTTPIHPLSSDEGITVWLILAGLAAAAVRVFHVRRRRSGQWRQGAADGEPGLVLTLVHDRVFDAAVFAVQLPVIARWARLHDGRELGLAIGWTLLALWLLWSAVGTPGERHRQIVLNAAGVRVHRAHFAWSQIRSVRLNPGAGLRLETDDRTLRVRGADYGVQDADVVSVLQFYLEHPERRGDLARLATAPPELRSH
ncbi:hypothetical protein CS0771_17620 [Catellatospora sp. IY07-71]|nr:hypothetical protein CS0771_17620 [Catellatospora sp. IY07-71]